MKLSLAQEPQQLYIRILKCYKKNSICFIIETKQNEST